MHMSRRGLSICIGSLLLAALSFRSESAATANLAPLHAEGAKMVDPSGKPVILRGCNVGNWLMFEAWMLRWDISDQQTLVATLTDRFGAEECQKLWDSYREGYITPRDFQLIKSF